MGLPVSTKITFPVSEENWSKAFKIASKIPVGSVIGREELVNRVQLPTCPNDKMVIDVYERWGDVPLEFVEQISRMIPTVEITIASGCEEAGDTLGLIDFLSPNHPNAHYMGLDGDNATVTMKDGEILSVKCWEYLHEPGCQEEAGLVPREVMAYPDLIKGTLSRSSRGCGYSLNTPEKIAAFRRKLQVTSSADALDPAAW